MGLFCQGVKTVVENGGYLGLAIDPSALKIWYVILKVFETDDIFTLMDAITGSEFN